MEKQFDFVAGELLLINKELKWTSFDAVNKIRYGLKHYLKINKIKVGHAGTLDPLATGLLIVCTGKKTKIIDSIQNTDKVYSGSFVIGATRPSQDLETEIDAYFDYSHITEEDIYQAAREFIGKQNQIPPMFSAIKVDGVRAYTHARADKTIELKSRPIEIFDFEITSIEMPNIYFRIHCSKGTYIRSIARDFGEKLNSGAYLGSLHREKIGDYDVVNSLTISQFNQLLQSISDSEI